MALRRVLDVPLRHLGKQRFRIVRHTTAINGLQLAQFTYVADGIAVDDQQIGMTSDTLQGPLRPGRSVPFDFGRVLCDGHGAYFVPCLICRKHARTSRTNVSGCSNAAKCPPFSSSLK